MYSMNGNSLFCKLFGIVLSMIFTIHCDASCYLNWFCHKHKHWPWFKGENVQHTVTPKEPTFWYLMPPKWRPLVVLDERNTNSCQLGLDVNECFLYGWETHFTHVQCRIQLIYLQKLLVNNTVLQWSSVGVMLQDTFHTLTIIPHFSCGSEIKYTRGTF